MDSEAPSELDVSPAQIERIAGGKTATVEVTFPATPSAGRYSARLTVDAPAASPSSAVVLSKADYADRATSSLSDLQERLSEVVAELNQPSRPFDNQVRKVQGDLQSAIDAIGSESQGDGTGGNSAGKSKGEGKSKGGKKGRKTGQSPNKHLELAVKHLNGLSGLIGSLQGIESGVRASLQSELDAIKDIIKNAITADA